MGNSASSLPYSIGKQIAIVNNGWALHEGSRKSDSANVAVFMAKKPTLRKTPVCRGTPSMAQLAPALHHFQNCKRLRHPHILQVFATLDTDHPNEGPAGQPPPPAKGSESGDLIIVTEPCVSLDAWLQTNPPPEEVAWGLEAIIRALSFLHTSANLAHGNLSPASFFVTPAGDVKLWNFSLVTPGGDLSRHFVEWEGLITPQPYRSPERQDRRFDAIAASGIHVMDSYGLGILIDHIYNGRIPGPLIKAVQRLQTPNLKMRPRLQALLKCPVFDTPYQKLQLQLEEFTVQPVEQKIAFWQNLQPTLQAGLVPEKMAVHKLLPLMKLSIETICQSDSMKAQDMYRRELSSILQPMFYIGENYLGDSFDKELTSVIALLFAVADRGVRGALLQKAGLFGQHLDQNALNTSVFEPMCSGFSDSSAALREMTLKAALGIVPHLTQPNLEKLSRYLVRLQNDSEASIRTNTVIFFSKLAPHLTEMSRQKLLLPAFLRAMRDPFKPCRLAALQSTLKSKEYFDPQGIATKVLPAVTPCTLDGAPDVRKEAFAVVEDLLFVLRQESERMSHMPEHGGVGNSLPAGPTPAAKPVAPTPAAAPQAHAPAPSSSGYLTGISSWMTSSAKPDAPPAPTTASARGMGPSSTMPRGAAAPAVPNMGTLNVNDDMNGLDDWDGDGGWDDDVDNLDTSSSGVKKLQVGVSQPPPPKPSGGVSLLAPVEDEDDFFGSFDAFDSKPAKPASMRKSTGGKLAVPGKKKTAKSPSATIKQKPAVKKLAVEDDLGDGWDDF